MVLPALSLLLLSGSGLSAQTNARAPKAAASNPTDDVIRFYEWRVARDPDDYFNYDKLGVAYVGKGRETGDAAYYELAEKALRKSLELESTHREAVSATAHLASVFFAEHRFQEALEYARKSLTFNTGDLSPHATIGDALLESGDYEEAAREYAKLDEPEGAPRPGIAYLRETRSSNLQFLKGNTQESIRHMRNAVRIANDAHMAVETIAWTQFTLGEECFQAGDLKCSDEANQDALRTYPGYHRALAGLARVRAAQERFPEAIDLYQKALAVIPLPLYAASLGDIYESLGRHDEAERQYDLVQVIGYLNALNKSLYNREFALFYADHDIKLSEALALSRKELELRHDVYTWDCLAWTLFKNGMSSEAADAMGHALSQGTVDALMFFHAGMIHESLGDTIKATQFLERALATNPQFHVSYALLAARSLARLQVGVR